MFEPADMKSDAQPIMIIDHKIMSFFGVKYFAPVDLKVSIHHDEVVFVRTKTGIMAININGQGIPELLFFLEADRPNYDF